MRILIVGNANQKHRGARYYDQVFKLYNGCVRTGHHVMFMSDRDVARAAPFKFMGHRRSNEHFVETCRNFRPEAILLFHADIIDAETIADVRAMLPGVRVAQFNVDIIFNEHNAAMIQSKLSVVDATFVTTAGKGLAKFAGRGGLVAYMPNMMDASIEWPRCFEYEEQESDVFWALRALKGSAGGDRRIDYPLYLEQNGVNIDYYGMNGKPLLFNHAYFETIAKAKMGINISQIWTRGHYERAKDEDLYLYSSDRIAHYMGSGLLTFCTRDHKLEELFGEDKEMVFFDSKEELLDKVGHYAKNDAGRRAIAQNGWTKYNGCFNERLVTQYALERLFNQKLSVDYRWPLESW